MSAAVLAEASTGFALPKFWEDHHEVLIETPIRIVVIILVGFLVRALARRVIDRAVQPVRGEPPRILRPFRERMHSNSFLESSGLLSERRALRATTLGSVLKSATTAIIFVICFLLILSELRINLAPFIAGTSIIGVALGFGAQNIVKDFITGMFMLIEDQYGVGDVIDFEYATGTVEAVGLRSTRLRDINGTVWYVRNGEVIRVGNKSQGFATVVLDVPVDAGADIEAVYARMLEIAKQMADEEDWRPVFLKEPEVQGVEDMTRFETTVRLAARVRPLEQWRTARELRRRIRDGLEEMGVMRGAPGELDTSGIVPPESGA